MTNARRYLLVAVDSEVSDNPKVALEAWLQVSLFADQFQVVELEGWLPGVMFDE